MEDRGWPPVRYEKQVVEGLPRNLHTPKLPGTGPLCQQCGDIEPARVRPVRIRRTYVEKVLSDLEKYRNPKDTRDVWGKEVVMLCGDNAPEGAPFFAVFSKGPDGKAGTEDDIRSW